MSEGRVATKDWHVTKSPEITEHRAGKGGQVNRERQTVPGLRL